MGYVEPRGKIIEASETGNVSRLAIEFDKMDSDPITPAGLYVDPKKGPERYQLHKLIKIEGSLYTFETFNSTHPLPKQDEEYSYRGWWLPEAMEAALDTNDVWVKKKYPDNGNHEHCLFTWETIASYAECSEGYYSEKYGWITCESYNNFIAGDIYRLRSESRA